ncbi:MAG: teichuronic acid biosynthesis glycosyltransferase TuaC, partial [Solirubrobacteraceae bacterium]|nr:teichuronic acid biosynthesis glycosyltransferase TuaC [Solirubrobacteraceae bacterium]
AAARMVLANSAGIAERIDARDVRVVHLGTDVPPAVERHDGPAAVVTVAHLIARKRHADVLRALPAGMRYDVVGDGPERKALEELSAELGHGDRVTFHGQLEHERALEVGRRADVFAMPSTDEAFGVAYVEAMAGWLPAIGAAGEPGPQEIVDAGDAVLPYAGGRGRGPGRGRGMTLVPPADPPALAAAIHALLTGGGVSLRAAGAHARATVQRAFSWDACGAATVAAYEAALAAKGGRSA